MVDLAQAYLETHEHLVELARSLSPEELETKVPASPEWSVKDVVGHVAGVAADAVAGNIPPDLDLLAAMYDQPQAATREDMTARQVELSRERTLEEIVEGWSASVRELMPMIRGERPFPRSIPFAGEVLVSDVATHAQDVRGAVGRPGDRDSAGVGVALASYAAGAGFKIDIHALPPLRIRYGSKERIAGRNGEPGATWSGDRFEIYRALAGRRSLDQMRAMEWEGDPDPYLPLLNAYGPRYEPIEE